MKSFLSEILAVFFHIMNVVSQRNWSGRSSRNIYVLSLSVASVVIHINIHTHIYVVVVVQSLSCVRLFVTPSTAAPQTSLSFTISLSLLKPMSIESVMSSNHLILCCPFSFCLLSFPASGSFSNESALHIRWPEYWSFNISPSNEYSELISFRIDSFYLLAVQGTSKILLQHHSSKASILWR